MLGAIVTFACLAAAFYLLKTVVEVLSIAWNSSLAPIPNAHWTSPYSPYWLLWIRGTGKEHSARMASHEKLGPIIRLGPKDISLDCIEGGVQTIYGGNWDKGEWYEAFENYGHHPSFSMTQAKPHAERKRMLAHVYTKTFVDNSTDFLEVMNVVNEDRLSPLLRSWAKEKTAVNVLPLTMSYNMDVSTAYIYGLGNATNWTENPEEAQVYLNAFEKALGPGSFFLQYFPTLTDLLSKVGVHLVKSEVFESFPVYLDLGWRLSDQTTKSVDAGSTGEKTTSPIVYNHLKQKLMNAGVPKEDMVNIVASEMIDQVHAGHEATGIILTYVMWELTKNADDQARLSQDFRSLRAVGKAPESSQLLEDILMETYRLHPAAWGPFPRRSPADGSGALGQYTNIPAGITASASPYTLGRNPRIFPSPEEWLPQRWEHASPKERKEMEKWVWMFGSGPRICLGRHLAIASMKSMMVAIYERYRTTVAQETDMTHVEWMMALPRDNKLMLHFTPL